MSNINQKTELEYLANNYYGVDYEDDSYYTVESSEINKDYVDLRREIILQKEQYSVEYLNRLIQSDYLDLSPEFQRNEVWQDNRRKSLFIESLLLNIPIPIFYAYSNEDERLSIIDGKQRLSTIRDFCNNQFRLSQMHYLKQYNGKLYNELPEKIKVNFDRYQCSFYVLNYLTPKRYIFDIFMRINTGGSPLTTQEIRNIFAKPKVRNLLKNMASSVNFKKATRQRVKDTRMDAQEMALRYIALRKNYDYEKYRLTFSESNLSELLDRTIGELNNETQDILDEYLCEFKNACDAAYELLGECAFSRLKIQGNRISPKSQTINKSLFAVFTVLLSNEKFKYIPLKKHSKAVLQDFVILQNEKVLTEVLSSSTGSKRNLDTLFYLIQNMIKECINVEN